MARLHYVKKARRTYYGTGIKKGSGYYWWKFNYGAKQRSKTKPKPQQLTRDDYAILLLDVDDIKDDLSVGMGGQDVSANLDSIKEMLDEAKDRYQESFDNMPDQLQETSMAGEILTERIEALESYMEDFEGIEVNDDMNEEELQGVIGEIQGTST